MSASLFTRCCLLGSRASSVRYQNPIKVKSTFIVENFWPWLLRYNTPWVEVLNPTCETRTWNIWPFQKWHLQWRGKDQADHPGRSNDLSREASLPGHLYPNHYIHPPFRPLYQHPGCTPFRCIRFHKSPIENIPLNATNPTLMTVISSGECIRSEKRACILLIPFIQRTRRHDQCGKRLSVFLPL